MLDVGLAVAWKDICWRPWPGDLEPLHSDRLGTWPTTVDASATARCPASHLSLRR